VSDALIHFHEFRLKKSELNSLTKEEKAIWGMLSYICNELNVFARLLRLSNRSEAQDAPIKFAADLQHHVVLRTLSSRVFEAYEFLSEASKKSRDVDQEILKLIEAKAVQIEQLGSAAGHSINRNIRNETSFHYRYKTALKNAGSLPEDADASIYISSLDGNTYFVFGESMMFIERLRKFSDADRKFEDPEVLAEYWLKWTLEVVKLIKQLQADLFGIVLEKLNKKARKTHYFVEAGFVAEENCDPIPVFVRNT
jgi:hypothetical protein